VTPVRIQRKRSKGWRMPANTVYVGRPTKYGNPYIVQLYRFAHPDGSPAPHDAAAAREMAVRDYEMWLEARPDGQALAQLAERELRGKDLACWCPLDQPCHADVLLEIANAPTAKDGRGLSLSEQTNDLRAGEPTHNPSDPLR
jgi:hypothetical protein